MTFPEQLNNSYTFSFIFTSKAQLVHSLAVVLPCLLSPPTPTLPPSHLLHIPINYFHQSAASRMSYMLYMYAEASILSAQLASSFTWRAKPDWRVNLISGNILVWLLAMMCDECTHHGLSSLCVCVCVCVCVRERERGCYLTEGLADFSLSYNTKRYGLCSWYVYM